MNKLTFDRKRPLSWSAISSFEYDPEQWYRKYVLGIKDPDTPEMLFGSMIGKKISGEYDPTFLPNLQRYPVYEYELKFNFGKIPMIGFIDGWEEKDHFALGEYKTGKRAWTQKRADEHGQFDTYLLGLWIMRKIRPEDVLCRLHWMPTQDTGDFQIELINPKVCHTFLTRRTMSQILQFGMRINSVYAAMDQYCKDHD